MIGQLVLFFSQFRGCVCASWLQYLAQHRRCFDFACIFTQARPSVASLCRSGSKQVDSVAITLDHDSTVRRGQGAIFGGGHPLITTTFAVVVRGNRCCLAITLSPRACVHSSTFLLANKRTTVVCPRLRPVCGFATVEFSVIGFVNENTIKTTTQDVGSISISWHYNLANAAALQKGHRKVKVMAIQ